MMLLIVHESNVAAWKWVSITDLITGHENFVRSAAFSPDGTRRHSQYLFDHLRGEREQRRRHRKPECLGGLEFDHQFESS